MDEIILERIEWTAKEYKHEEKSIDFFWTLGLVALVCSVIAIWFGNYLFGIFILVSGLSLFLFTIRHPQEITFLIETEGLSMGSEKYSWKKVKGFNIKKQESSAILLIRVDKYLLPVYTIPVPLELVPKIKESLLKVTPSMELNESGAVKFMEKIGF